jgi:hypothetical protein
LARRPCYCIRLRACANRVFRFVVDDGGHGTYRTCVRCDAFEVAVGFTLYADGHAVRAIGVGVRCATDGMLGSPAEWNIQDHPSLHLLQQV